MITEHTKETPDVMSCPPLVFVGALTAGLLLNWLVPLRSFACLPSHIVGGLLGFMGTVIGFWGIHALHRSGTAVRPDHPVSALVTDGPFRYSRNPLYVALTMIYVGLAISLGAWWPLATLVPALAIVHWRIVRREEQFLEGRFGDIYRVYKTRVRRWV